MICVHVLEVYASPEVINSIFGQVIEFLGGPPAAPVFMMLMGLSFAYSKKKDMRSGVIRGIKVLLLGYLLNLLRGVLPIFIAKQIGLASTEAMTPEQSNLLNILLIADILQFAGIALIIMAIIRELRISRFLLICIAFLISMTSPFLWGIEVKIPILGHLLNLLWGDQPLGGFIDNMVNFPVFPWIVFPIIGIVIGDLFACSSDITKSFKQMGLIGAIIMLIGAGITATNPDYHMNDYYHSRQGAMIFMVGFTLIWLYMCYILTLKISRNKVFDLLYNWSRNVTAIYFIQWVLIIWCIFIFGMNMSSFPSTIFIIILLSLMSNYLSKDYIYILKLRKEKLK